MDILTVKEFLNASEMLVENSQKLQALCKRAASEIVVRQALAELDQWDVQSRFVLNLHTYSLGRNILLIKEFKEILNKIGDNQSLLQSVKNSADYDSFLERAEIWEQKLLDLDKYVTSLAQIQRKSVRKMFNYIYTLKFWVLDGCTWIQYFLLALWNAKKTDSLS